jgi:hypothetical protein
MVYESLEAYCLHHLLVPEIYDLAALSIRNSLIPQSVTLEKSTLFLFYSLVLYPKQLLETAYYFFIL